GGSRLARPEQPNTECVVPRRARANRARTQIAADAKRGHGRRRILIAQTSFREWSTRPRCRGLCWRSTREAGLFDAGASLADVVRARYLLPNRDDFEPCWPVL